MIDKRIISWFQEEIKKEISDILENRDAPTMALSLMDEDGIVWIEGFKQTTIEPFKDGEDHLIQYSIHREEAFTDDFPFSISITVIN